MESAVHQKIVWLVQLTVKKIPAVSYYALLFLTIKINCLAEKCGDGVCDVDVGESCESCYEDCKTSCGMNRKIITK